MADDECGCIQCQHPPHQCIKDDACRNWTNGPYSHSLKCEQRNMPGRVCVVEGCTERPHRVGLYCHEHGTLADRG